VLMSRLNSLRSAAVSYHQFILILFSFESMPWEDCVVSSRRPQGHVLSTSRFEVTREHNEVRGWLSDNHIS
jgi:hypothetical protein